MGKELDETEPRRWFDPLCELPGRDAKVERDDEAIKERIARAQEKHAARTAVKKIGLAGDSATRKNSPVYEGFLCYFPNAIAEVARLSKFGNDKHNPGQPLHWSFDKSNDHGDCILRHQAQAEELDESTVFTSAPADPLAPLPFLHAVMVAWRAMAQLETLLLKRHPELKPGKNVKRAA